MEGQCSFWWSSPSDQAKVFQFRKETKTSASIATDPLPYVQEVVGGMTGTGKLKKREFREIYNIRVVQFNKSDCSYYASRPSLQAKSKIQVRLWKMSRISSWKRSTSPSRCRCGPKAVITPFSIVGSRQRLSLTKFWLLLAQIVANAGQRGAVTIATNMAGRGWYQLWWRWHLNSVDFVSSGQGHAVVGSITSFVDIQDVKGSRVVNSVWRWIDAPFQLTDQKQCLIASSWAKKKNQWSFKYVHTSSKCTKRVEGNNYDTVNKSFNTMTWCKNARSIYAERYDVITANRDLAPEIKAMIRTDHPSSWWEGASHSNGKNALARFWAFAKPIWFGSTISASDIEENLTKKLSITCMHVQKSMLAK